MQIKYSKKALKFLAKQERSAVTRIRSAIEKLTLTPPEGDIKPLSGQRGSGKMRLRVGSFRIIFRFGVENNIEILFIDDIGNRGDIYKNL